MAKLEGVFDPNSIPPNMGGGQQLPVSTKDGHLVVITNSEFKHTKDNTGQMLALTLSIQDGPFAGSEGVWNLNLGNSNQTTVRIAQQELSCICHAIAYLQPVVDTEVLHGKPFRVVIAQQKKNPEYTEVVQVLRADKSKLSDKPGSASGPVAPPPGVAAPGFPPAPAAAPMAQPQQPQQPPQTQWVQPQPAPQAQQPQPPQAAPQWQPPGPQQPAAPAPQWQPPQQPQPQPPQQGPPMPQMPWAQPPQQ